MPLPVRPQDVATHFGFYLDEFHEFFTATKLPFGTPDDLPEFIERISVPGSFSEDVSSLIRSITYREHEQISGTALANLLAVAIGGPTVEKEAGKMEGPFRDLSAFVYAAMRPRRDVIPEELPTEEANFRQVSATERPSLPRRESEIASTLFAASQMTPPGSEAPMTRGSRVESGADYTSANGTDDINSALFAKWSNIQKTNNVYPPPVTGTVQRIAAGIVIGLVVLAGAIYLMWPALTHREAADPVAVKSPVLPDAYQKSGAAEAAMCVNPTMSLVSREDLNGRYKAAQNLVDQHRFSEALPQLREIAILDPGLPGINLSISEAWLNLKQTEQARTALESQYMVSSCLAKLPVTGLTSYCASEFPNLTLDACRDQNADYSRAAQTLGALVQPTLEQSAPPAPAATVAKARVPVRPQNLEAQPSPRKKTVVTEAPPARRSSDRSLVDGEGTDASLGAYTRQ